MNKMTQMHVEDVRLRVWSGFYSPDDVQELITQLLDEGGNELELREFARKEFQKKEEEEASWPDVTDCDRLIHVVVNLRESGVVAQHCGGWDKGEAFHNCLEEYREMGEPDSLFGICFYTEQDVDDAIEHGSIHLGFCSTRPESEKADSQRTAELICRELENAELEYSWSGKVDERIEVKINWQFRNYSRPQLAE